ncbi:MAG: nucleoside hydrolase [Candidatus Cyclobacteriaceae bacterium M3_2C_046]
MMKVTQIVLGLVLLGLWSSCTSDKVTNSDKIPVVFDTDANNELDDQHALAYLLMNGETFDLKAVTVNATYNGGDIEGHYQEAERVMRLCQRENVPLLKGANDNFDQIKSQVDQEAFDGAEAVDFIIETAKVQEGQPLVVLAVGKLTNVALALEKDPSIASNIRLVWLGSNYPKPGEYNQDNDTVSMNYLLNHSVPFEMVTVRYGEPSGTSAVRVTKEEINQNMPGKGPQVDQPVMGRHGQAFNNFGDYSVNLFEHIDYHGEEKSRALFDMAAVAIVKNPDWGEVKEIPAPILIDNQWVERPDNDRSILLWENFDRDQLIEDFYHTMEHYHLVSVP